MGAGPFRRMAGWLVDGVIALFFVFVGVAIGTSVSSFLAVVFTVVSLWLYFALLESSSTQGTLAKMLLNERVTDLRGDPITFERASVRHFSMYLSVVSPLFIGFLMAFWTRRRQALHDYLSSTIVTHTRSAGP